MKLSLVVMNSLILVLTGVLAAQTRVEPQSETEDRTATVEVLVFDQIGGMLPNARVAEFEDSDGNDYASKFQNGVASRIPFGRYVIEVSYSGFRTTSRSITVFQGRKTIVMALEVGGTIYSVYEVPSGYELRGRVVGAPLPTAGQVFVKVTSVFSDYSVESAIGPDGEFELVDLDVGPHLLLVVSQDSILASRIIRVPDEPPLEIKIGADPVFRWR